MLDILPPGLSIGYNSKIRRARYISCCNKIFGISVWIRHQPCFLSNWPVVGNSACLDNLLQSRRVRGLESEKELLHMSSPSNSTEVSFFLVCWKGILQHCSYNYMTIDYNPACIPCLILEMASSCSTSSNIAELVCPLGIIVRSGGPDCALAVHNVCQKVTFAQRQNINL